MKIYNNMNITYSAIEQNSRKNTKQKIIIFNGTDAYVRNAYVMRIYTCT